ncbi:MAG: ATP-binding protein [Archangium sp.]|nr:ATP-binding protein [Archangium sp.]
MLSRFTALVDALTPAQASEDEADRARFLVQIWLLGLGGCLAFAPLNVWSRMWGQLALTMVMFIAAAVILLLLRNSTRLSIITQVSLATLTLAFGASALMQTPADTSNLLTLVLVPLVASYLLVRHSFIWVIAASVTGALSLVLASRGVTVPVTDPEPLTSGIFNISVIVALSWVLTRRFDQLRRNALERMAQADRAKTVFLATVGHEIRTPMNGVLGMTEVMLEEPQSPTQRDQLQVIQRSGRGLVSLINDLLDLTRLEAKKLAVDAAPFDLGAVLADFEALARPLSARKGLGLVITKGPGVPQVVRGDGMRLTQVLTNLVNNAIKFTDVGEVRASVTLEAGRLRFEVRDTGIGIAPEVLLRLFRPFEQADGSSTRRYGGTGLGLAISGQLVGLMGGRIEVKSTPGKGSTFSFSLPCVPAQLEPVAHHAPLVAETRSRRVLVVDDNPVNLRVASSLVEKAGFISLPATSGREALEVMHAQGDVALVLMDCHMPDMDGFEATERIRAMPAGLLLPIVALTASATPDDVAACRRAGMTEVLAKPIRLDTLREVLGRLLGS